MFVLSVHESGKLSIEQCSTEIHLRIGKVIITESQMTKKKKSFFYRKLVLTGHLDHYWNGQTVFSPPPLYLPKYFYLQPQHVGR